jgi:hypothetical protein
MIQRIGGYLQPPPDQRENEVSVGRPALGIAAPPFAFLIMV